MSDKIIRIGSQQGFAESWDVANKPSSLNLVDFEVHPGLIVDMTRSYIAFNTQIQPSPQTLVTSAAATPGTTNKGVYTSESPLNSMLKLDGLEGTNSYEAPNAALIRNARISCDKGHIESIRRVDTLKSALFNMEHDREERKDDMNAFTAPKGALGLANQSSYFLDTVIRNTDGAGNAITGETSRQLSRDVKVPLKSIFGIAEGADAWDTSKFGTTRIHCETNWKNVKVEQLGGLEQTSNKFDEKDAGAAAIKWGQMKDQVALGAGASVTKVVTQATYLDTDYQQTSPWFVGQRVQLTGNVVAVGLYTDIPFVISKIELNTTIGNADYGSLEITFDPAINAEGIKNEDGSAQNVNGLLMKADHTATQNVIVNRAELVLFTRPPMDTPSEYQYVTYTTEEDNGNGITSFARGYTMEAEAEQMIVCLAPQNDILPTTAYESYRYAVDNKDMTGNRSVFVNSPIQYDRLNRALNNQYTDWRSAQLKFFQQTVATTQATSYGKPNSTIVETLPLSDRPKYVDLQIECAGGVAELKIYKQMVRSIKA